MGAGGWRRTLALVAFAVAMMALGAALAAIMIDERASRRVDAWLDSAPVAFVQEVER